MNSASFRRRLLILWILSWFQRSVRLLLRAAWMAGGTVLLAWGVNGLWGWLPNPKSWIILGAIVGAVSLILILYQRPKLNQLAWHVDRKLGTQEQISAAWQVVQAGRQDSVAAALVTETTILLRIVIGRVLVRGWYVMREFVSLTVIVLLFLVIIWRTEEIRVVPMPLAVQSSLPSWKDDPTADEILSSDISGLPDVPASPLRDDKEQPESQVASAESTWSPDEIEAALKFLEQLGKDLSKTAASYDVGQALQRRDFNDAADEMEVLSQQLDALSINTRFQMANALQVAGVQLATIGTGQAGSQVMSEHMQGAASGLREGSGVSAGEKLDQVTSDLRAFGHQLFAASAAGAGEIPGDNSSNERGTSAAIERQQGDSQPLERIYGEGSTLELGQVGEEQDVIAVGSGAEEGKTIAAPIYDHQVVPDSSVSTGVLTPYRFSWEWRDVVSDYFSTR